MTDFKIALEELHAAELALVQQREEVAALRRALPAGPTVDDYRFASLDGGSVALSELSTGSDRPLVLYHFMLGKAQAEPCPMCAMWADAWNAVADHVAERLDLVMVSAASADRTNEVVASRGWTNLKWVSAAGNSFKLDIGGEDLGGNQWPFISVYDIDDPGPRLSYSGSAIFDPDHGRGLDLLSPVWHLLDLTRQGRGEWMPSLR